jgi:putative ABC transport system permease protein
MLTRRGDERFRNLAEMITIEGMQLPENLHLKSGVYEQGLLRPEKGGGRFLELSDVGKPNILISTKIARDYPHSDGTPKKVGDTQRQSGIPSTFQVSHVLITT